MRLTVPAVLAIIAIVTSSFMLKSPAPIGPGSDAGRSPYVTNEIVGRILQTEDRAAVYRILPHYADLSGFERAGFWNAAGSLEMYELAGFARVVLPKETDPLARQFIVDFIEDADR